MSADIIDTPLTRLKTSYDKKIAEKDVLISEMMLRVKESEEKVARIKGLNSMLHLLLADMAASVSMLSQQVEMMSRNIGELRRKLPALDN